MSHYERNMRYLQSNKIIYRRDPITDKPSQVYAWGKFYEDGTHECYELFRSKAKITTYKSSLTGISIVTSPLELIDTLDGIT